MVSVLAERISSEMGDRTVNGVSKFQFFVSLKRWRCLPRVVKIFRAPSIRRLEFLLGYSSLTNL